MHSKQWLSNKRKALFLSTFQTVFLIYYHNPKECNKWAIFLQVSEGEFGSNLGFYLSPISPCSVCLYLRHLCGGDQSRTFQMSVCIAQAAPHAWRRQISAVRTAWREMIHTDYSGYLHLLHCSTQPTTQKAFIYFSCCKSFQLFRLCARSICISQISHLETVEIYWQNCTVKAKVFIMGEFH